MYTVLIRNGRVIDGAGNPWYSADVALQGGTVAAVGKLRGAAAGLVVDAGGLVVSPGFIDIHTHSDGPLLVEGAGHSHIRQGVTTNVIGNCGTSLAPVTDRAIEYLKPQRVAEDPDLVWDWKSMGEFLARLERQGVSINVVPLIGHGSVRGSVMGFADRPPTASELAEMKEMVAAAMRDGAFGLSSGLIYVPGSYSTTDEVAELAKVAAEHGGIYATHIRGENDTLLEAVAEAIEIGRRACMPVEIAHFKAMGRHMWGKSVDSLRMVEDARAAGIDVTCDQYPYNASATGLGAYMPAWAHVGGAGEMKKRLQDPAARTRMKHDILSGVDGWVSLYKGVGWDNTVITRSQGHEEFEGLTVAEIAKQRGRDDFDTAFDILLECGGRVGVVYFTIGDEDLERIMRHPAVMIGSDSSAIAAEGPLSLGKPHPRAFGTFVRVLGHYVREKQTISLQEAVRKMTSLPAQKLGLYDRGLLRPGMKADVVVFDPETVADRATYTDPWQYPAGIRHVFVNGRHTISDGEHLGTMGGAVLRMTGRP
ncbi:MAG: D-aminoacylase [Bacillota bacterium]|nr:D-aminoacylase [Bacillota bacterium]